MNDNEFAESLKNAHFGTDEGFKTIYSTSRVFESENGQQYQGHVWQINDKKFAPGFTVDGKAQIFMDHASTDLNELKPLAAFIGSRAAKFKIPKATSTE